MKGRIIDFLRKNPGNIVLTSHINPDGDAIGSALGFAHYLQGQGFNVNVIFPNQPSIPLRSSLGYYSSFVHIDQQDSNKTKKIISQANTLFALDYNISSRVGAGMSELIDNFSGTRILVDHHESPDHSFDYMYSLTSKSSTCEMIFDLIENDGGAVDIACADNLLMGLITDTGSFKFPVTSSRTHEVAGKLLELGAQPSVVHDRLFDNNPKSRILILGRVLSNIVITEDSSVAILWISSTDLNELNYQPGDTEGIVNQGLGIKGVKMSVFIREDSVGSLKLSFRSKGDVSVNDYSRKHWQGGGHKNASGGLSELTIQETIDKVKSTYKEVVIDD
tara:strand:- start:13826 stop:14827 length:1002 start_codon:yes stop_codon:yes gene_type:complete